MWRAMMLALAIVIACPFLARGQQWSPAQQEAWQTVEAYWQCFAEGDAECFLTYLHDDFSGWTNTNALPRDKEDMSLYLPLGFETSQTLLHDVDPVAINVHDNVAIVHYYYSRTFVDSSGARKSDTGRWTDILKKQGDRWVMIADHGGSDGGT
jgi:ketosteroid isomerase-like protein